MSNSVSGVGGSWCESVFTPQYDKGEKTYFSSLVGAFSINLEEGPTQALNQADTFFSHLNWPWLNRYTLVVFVFTPHTHTQKKTLGRSTCIASKDIMCCNFMCILSAVIGVL